jgi:hypothetical protein
MVIVIYTPDGYWIGADSARAGEGKRVETVCKVHETKFGLLLKSGRSQGTTAQGDGYSTDKEVEDLLAASASAEEFKESLRLRFKQDVEAELIHAIDNPKVTPQTFSTTRMSSPIPAPWIPVLTRSALLFESDGQHRLGEALVVMPQSDPLPAGLPGRTAYRYWAPSTLGWHPIDDPHLHLSQVNPENGTPISYPASVRMFSYAVSYPKPDTWVRTHPKQALLEMLGLGHAEQPQEIGPPYVLVHVVLHNGKKPITHWKERGVCPSWTEDILPDDMLQRLREAAHP